MVADKATFNALSGDPRRPDTVVAYQQPENAEDKVDPYSTIGMLLSGLGVFARVRVFNFIALAFAVSAFIQRTSDTDPKQLMMSITISLVGILFTSMQPPGTPPTNTTDLASGVAATAAADGSGTFQDL